MKKTTINDIAKMAGVSKATVSMVINKKDENISVATRKKILNIANKIGYIPNSVARSLNTNKTATIGIIVPDITNPFFSQISRSIEDTANGLNYNVILCNSDNNIEKEILYIKLLISKQVDGVILISGGNKESANILKMNQIPFVLVDRYIEGFNNELGVYCNNVEGVSKGVDFLYSKGKRNIVFVNATTRSYVFKERLNGFVIEMKKYGIFKSENIFESNLNIQDGMKITENILNQVHNLDAIFYCSDLVALGGIKTLTRRQYKIPQDIAIMGYDGILITKFVEPELTTIAQPISEMGSNACEILVKNINGKTTEKRMVLEPKLIVRGTV